MPSPPLDAIVGRVPALPAGVARALYESPDPFGAVRTLLAGSAGVEAALLLASPALHGALVPWLAGGAAKSERAARKALAYAIRMATRCTPFGLFATSGTVELGAATTLALAGASSRRYRVTPSIAWLSNLLGTAREEHRDMTVIANDLVVARGNRLYAYHDDHARQVADGARAVWRQDAVSIRSNAAVAWVRTIARDEQTVRELVGRVMERFGAAPEIAHQLVRKLIDAAILVPVRPSLQGDPVAYARSLPELSTRAASLHELDTALDTFAQPGAAIAPADVTALDARVRAVHELDGPVVQIDAFHAFTGTLGAELRRDLALLASISLAHEAPAALRGFVKQFVDRYEAADRLVPLLELVHDGFTVEGDVVDEAAARREGLLARMASEALREGRREVVLADADLRALYPRFEPYRVPNACEIGFQIVARDRAAIAAGDYAIAAPASLTSDGIAKTASRIAEMLGPAFSRRVGNLHAADADGDALDVELDFHPLDARVSNLLVRPAWHAYAIADASIVTPAVRISPADVLIGFDDGRFSAYSKSLGRRLRVNETYLLETSWFAPPHARILSLIAKQDRIAPKPWSWGAAASHLEALPRVRYGRLVLAPAAWAIPKSSLLGEPDAFGAALARWRATWDVPRWVYLTERDLRLLLDLDAPVALALLRDQLGAYGGELLRFEEMLPSFDQLWLEDPAGNRYAHEFVATVPASVAAPRRTPRDLTTCDREQLPSGPGGAWTYVKMYGAEAELDALLRDHAGRIVAACAEHADLDRWFFLRYRDPQHHLRLRLRARHGEGTALVAHLSALLEPLLADGALRRYAFDTYEPELERYGGAAAQTPVQRLFRRDSERVLEALASPAHAGDRVRTALRSLAPFASAWFKRIPAKSWLDYHAAEARAEKDATDYALVRELDTWLADAGAQCDATDDAAIAELVALDAAGTLTQPANAIFSAIVHMHFNRVGIAYDDEPVVRAHLWRAVYGRSVRPRTGPASGKKPVEAA